MKWYSYNICDLTQEEYNKYFEQMSQDKKERVLRMAHDDDKKRTVAGEALARRAISEWCNVPEESICFKKHQNGKPFVCGLNAEFNISHSGDMVVCAVSDKPVGIDIERIRQVNLNLAKRICTEEELNYIFSSESEQSMRFFKIWTTKEAYAKYTGEGISQISRSIANDVLITQPEIEGYFITIISAKY